MASAWGLRVRVGCGCRRGVALSSRASAVRGCRGGGDRRGWLSASASGGESAVGGQHGGWSRRWRRERGCQRLSAGQGLWRRRMALWCRGCISWRRVGGWLSLASSWLSWWLSWAFVGWWCGCRRLSWRAWWHLVAGGDSGWLGHCISELGLWRRVAWSGVSLSARRVGLSGCGRLALWRRGCGCRRGWSWRPSAAVGSCQRWGLRCQLGAAALGARRGFGHRGGGARGSWCGGAGAGVGVALISCQQVASWSGSWGLAVALSALGWWSGLSAGASSCQGALISCVGFCGWACGAVGAGDCRAVRAGVGGGAQRRGRRLSAGAGGCVGGGWGWSGFQGARELSCGDDELGAQLVLVGAV